MKNLFLALALVGYIGATTASSVVLSNENAICFHEEKGKKDKKKKDAKSCAKTETEAKSCDKGATKPCCAKKADATKTDATKTDATKTDATKTETIRSNDAVE
ncbi:MAG: hypothetical protein H0V01_07565 [Bacteroidetes bacterium]|nr:hypothetical protein [Bacteroidota bacterium]HET6243969.1 hypothetical protein [Bacteroidia bacterium]